MSSPKARVALLLLMERWRSLFQSKGDSPSLMDIPCIYLLYTFHTPFTYLPYTFYKLSMCLSLMDIPFIYLLHTFYIPSTYLPYTLYILFIRSLVPPLWIYLLFTSYILSIYLLHTCHIPSIYFLCDL